MATNTLTDAKCRAIKSGDKAQKIFDGLGLFLFVSPTGAKVWRMAYRVNGKAQTAVIGPYPAVGLAEARQKRDGTPELTSKSSRTWRSRPLNCR